MTPDASEPSLILGKVRLQSRNLVRFGEASFLGTSCAKPVRVCHRVVQKDALRMAVCVFVCVCVFLNIWSRSPVLRNWWTETAVVVNQCIDGSRR